MDVVFIAVGLAGIALAGLYVRGCERIVGRDAPAEAVRRGEPGSPR